MLNLSQMMWSMLCCGSSCLLALCELYNIYEANNHIYIVSVHLKQSSFWPSADVKLYKRTSCFEEIKLISDEYFTQHANITTLYGDN